MESSILCILSWGSIVVQQTSKGLQIPPMAKWYTSISSQLFWVVLSSTKVPADRSFIHLHFDWRLFSAIGTSQFSLHTIPGFLKFF